MSIPRISPVFAAYSQPTRATRPRFGSDDQAETSTAPDAEPVAATASAKKHKASTWDWFVRGAVALTMAFSAVTATAAVIIEHKVASVEQRVPSQKEIDTLEAKINERLDALPDGEQIHEYVDEIEQTRADIEKLREFAETSGLTSEDSKDLAERINRLTERLEILERFLR